VDELTTSTDSDLGLILAEQAAIAKGDLTSPFVKRNVGCKIERVDDMLAYENFGWKVSGASISVG
jgi:hypothetical protein